MGRSAEKKYFPLIEKLLSSKLTAREFCEREGINMHTLNSWKKKYRESKTLRIGFTPLSIIETESKHPMTIHYTDGTRLIFEGGAKTVTIKEFIPAFNK